MKIVISEQPAEIHAMRHMREYIQIMQQRGTTVNYSANMRSGFLFPTSVYTEKNRSAPGEYVNLARPLLHTQPRLEAPVREIRLICFLNQNRSYARAECARGTDDVLTAGTVQLYA